MKRYTLILLLAAAILMFAGCGNESKTPLPSVGSSDSGASEQIPEQSGPEATDPATESTPAETTTVTTTVAEVTTEVTTTTPEITTTPEAATTPAVTTTPESATKATTSTKVTTPATTTEKTSTKASTTTEKPSTKATTPSTAESTKPVTTTEATTTFDWGAFWESLFFPTDAEPEPEPEFEYAAEEDCEVIADKIIEYINQYRVEQGDTPAAKLPGLTMYAEYRAQQLITNFAHDLDDMHAAAEALQFGYYVENPAPNLDGTPNKPYWKANAREAIGMVKFTMEIDGKEVVNASAEGIADSLAKGFKNSAGHWAYVGSSDYPYIGVGVTYDNGEWYCAIEMMDDYTYNSDFYNVW